MNAIKSISYSLAGCLMFIACEPSLKSYTADKSIRKEINFTMDSLSKEDFEIVEKQDTIFYIKKGYGGIDGKKINFDETNIKNIEAKIKFQFSFLQYTIDDNPAFPISFSKESNWGKLKPENGGLQIPSFHGQPNTIQVHEVLGLSNNKDITRWIEKYGFEQIRKESYKHQDTFYRQLMDNQKKYETCCPEYIAQAQKFLKTKIEDFKTTEDLGLELFYNCIVLEIKGQLKDGQEFRKVIVEK